jgi:glycosyltransferase involved in cell wall biosynthesis
MPKTLFLLLGDHPSTHDARVAVDARARDQFVELANLLRSARGGEVDFLDYEAVRADPNGLVQFLRRHVGMPAAQAVSAFRRLNQYDSVFSAGETAGVPLALVMAWRRRRPHHVCLLYDPVKEKFRLIFRWLRPARCIDKLIVYSDALRKNALAEFHAGSQQVLRLKCHVDTRFYRPMNVARGGSILVGSAGSDKRDYAMLIRAAAELRELSFKIVPTGLLPLLNKKPVPDMPVPDNVQFLKFEKGGLRDFYAPCDIVGIPVRENDTTNGLTTLLEAMAMAKPVIVTRTRGGLAEYVVDGETGLSVEPGDVEGWKVAIRRLAIDPGLRERLGRNARRWVEENATLEIWANGIADALLAPGPIAVEAGRSEKTSHIVSAAQ